MLPGQHRRTARVILTNKNGQFLLFLTHFDPEIGLPPRWITPGGGIDHGETELAAAVRELAEETGIQTSESDLIGPIWQTSGRWDWADGQNHHTFEDVFFELKDGKVLDSQIDQTSWTDDEHRDILQIRWWNLEDLIETAELVSPPGLAAFLASHFDKPF